MISVHRLLFELLRECLSLGAKNTFFLRRQSTSTAGPCDVNPTFGISGFMHETFTRSGNKCSICTKDPDMAKAGLLQRFHAFFLVVIRFDSLCRHQQQRLSPFSSQI